MLHLGFAKLYNFLNHSVYLTDNVARTLSPEPNPKALNPEALCRDVYGRAVQDGTHSGLARVFHWVFV